jgi:iron complex outermembrane receptor protein
MKYFKISTWLVVCLVSIHVTGQIDTTIQNKYEDSSKFQNIREVVVQGKSNNKIVSNWTDIPDMQMLSDKVLESLNGVTLIKRGNYAQEPTVRGLNAAQINTTIDGMQMFGACTDRMDPISSYVEPNNMNSLSLQLGPNDNQTGSSIGGGFDFKLKKAELAASKKWSGMLGAGYETNASAMQALGALQYSQKRFAIQGNYIYRKANNYIAGGNQEILFSQYEKWNLGINAVFQISKNQYVYLDYIQDNGINIGYPALTMDVAFANAKIGSINHVLKRSGKKMYQLDTKVYYNFIDHAMDDTRRPAEMVPMHMDMPGTSQTSGFYSNSSWRLSEKHFFKAKLNAYQNDLHAEMTMYPTNGAEMFMLTIPDARRNVYGVDLSDKWYITPKTVVSFGGRYDYVQSSIITILGRQTMSSLYSEELDKSVGIYNFYVQMKHPLNHDFSFTYGVAKAMRQPSLQELYGFYLFNRVDSYDYLGNPDLKPESSWNFNAGLTWKKKRYRIETNLFSYQFSNYITGQKRSDFSVMTIGGKGVKQYVNIPNATINGFEVSAQIRILSELYFSTNNSISYGFDNLGNALPFIPPFKTINTLKYNLKGFNFNLTQRAASDQKHVASDIYGEKASYSFHVYSVGVGKIFQKKAMRLEVKLLLDNVFDEVYYEHLDVMKINRQGRSLILHTTFSF